jgi:cell division topological specificity factor
MVRRDHDLRPAKRVAAHLKGCVAALGPRRDRDVRPPGSASVACERLRVMLKNDRDLFGETDLITVLQEEILGVVSRHLAVDPDTIQVSVNRRPTTLAMSIAIPNVQHKGYYPLTA